MVFMVTVKWTSLVLIEGSFTKLVLKLSNLRSSIFLASKLFALARNLVHEFQLNFDRHVAI